MPSGIPARLGAATIVVAALCIRIPDIIRRPFHTDEAVNAFLLGDLLSGDGYVYRPHDHHGPTLYYLTALPAKLAGVTGVADMEAWPLRLVTVFAGTAAVAGVFMFRRTLGDAVTAAAAGFLALAAPFVYYSGAFIHESLLLALTVPFFAALWHWRETGGRRAAAIAGLLAGLMVATKETAVPIGGAAVLAILPGIRLPKRRAVAGAVLATTIALATIALFFSDFFRHPDRLAALGDALRLQPARGLGAEHAHPWYTYLQWAGAPGAAGLPWSGWCLAGFGLYGTIRGRRTPLIRAAALFSGLLAVFHCALPYKTPWLMPAIMLPFAIPAGYGFVDLLGRLRRRELALLATGGVAMLLLRETYVRAYRDDVSPDNPLAYAPSSPDTARLEHDVARLAATSAAVTAVHVVARDYWPVPWALRRLPAGYASEPPEAAPAGLLICGPEALGAYADRGPFTSYDIRPGVVVFVSSDTTVGNTHAP